MFHQNIYWLILQDTLPFQLYLTFYDAKNKNNKNVRERPHANILDESNLKLKSLLIAWTQFGQNPLHTLLFDSTLMHK